MNEYISRIHSSKENFIIQFQDSLSVLFKQYNFRQKSC